LIHIDVDRDSLISTTEAATYIELLKRDLAARIDGRETALVLTASHFPPPAELRTGHGIAKVEFALAIGRLAGGTHRLTVENRHFPAIGAYLFNAARPQSDRVRIIRQARNDNQSTGEIEFDYDAPANASPQGGNSNVPSDVSCSGRILQCMGRADFQRLRRAFQRSRRAFGR
jgi:hypothetical protein